MASARKHGSVYKQGRARVVRVSMTGAAKVRLHYVVTFKDQKLFAFWRDKVYQLVQPVSANRAQALTG